MLRSLRNLRNALNNWWLAQLSPIYSPVWLGDRIEDNVDAWIDYKKRKHEPVTGGENAYLPALFSHTVQHQPQKTAAIFVLVVGLFYAIPWREISLQFRDEFEMGEIVRAYLIIAAYSTLANLVSLVFIGFETTRSITQTLLYLPRAVCFTLPFSFFPSSFIPILIYSGSILIPHPHLVFFMYANAKLWLAAYYVALFKKGSFTQAIEQTSYCFKGRPIITLLSGGAAFSAAFAPGFAAMILLVPLHVIGTLTDLIWQYAAPYAAFATFFAMHAYAKYAAAVQFDAINNDYQAIREQRLLGRYVPDTFETRALGLIEYEPEHPIDVSAAARILHEKLGIDDPYCFVGPIKPALAHLKPGAWCDFFYDRPARPNLKQESIGRVSGGSCGGFQLE